MKLKSLTLMVMAVPSALPKLELRCQSTKLENSPQQETRLDSVNNQGQDNGISSVHDISWAYGIKSKLTLRTRSSCGKETNTSSQ